MQIIIDPAQVSVLLHSGFLQDDDAIDLVIENGFTILDDMGMLHELNPASPGTLTPVLGLLLAPLRSLEVDRDGTLILRLGKGAELRVTKKEKYESWHSFGRGELADASMLCSGHEGPPWRE